MDNMHIVFFYIFLGILAESIILAFLFVFYLGLRMYVEIDKAVYNRA